MYCKLLSVLFFSYQGCLRFIQFVLMLSCRAIEASGLIQTVDEGSHHLLLIKAAASFFKAFYTSLKKIGFLL